MQGILNISGYALLVGAFGQSWFYTRFFAHVPHWLVLGVLLLPWLAVHTISFCNRAPFGPRPYRRCLLGAMCWYTLLTVLAETGQHFMRLPPDGHIPVAAARCLMYFGWISFIPFIRAYRLLLKYETEEKKKSEVCPPK